MAANIAARIVGTPTKQEALLFSKIVTAQPPVDSTIESLHDYLEEHGVLERYRMPLQPITIGDENIEGAKSWLKTGRLLNALRALHNCDAQTSSRDLFQRQNDNDSFFNYEFERVEEWSRGIAARLAAGDWMDATDRTYLNHGTRMLTGLLLRDKYPQSPAFLPMHQLMPDAKTMGRWGVAMGRGDGANRDPSDP